MTSGCTSDGDCGGSSRGQCLNGTCSCLAGFGGDVCEPCAIGQYGVNCSVNCSRESCSGSEDDGRVVVREPCDVCAYNFRVRFLVFNLCLVVLCKSLLGRSTVWQIAWLGAPSRIVADHGSRSASQATADVTMLVSASVASASLVGMERTARNQGLHQ